jgi:NADP-dependent 3-hydroxy acid dehydrogenase YdfG
MFLLEDKVALVTGGTSGMGARDLENTGSIPA